MGGDRVRRRVNFLAPNVFEEHVSRDDAATVSEEVCKHHEFLPGQVNRRALQRDPVASGIDSEVADLEHFFLDAKRPAQERPDSREQFLRGKGFGQAIIGTGVEQFRFGRDVEFLGEDQDGCYSPAPSDIDADLKPGFR